MARHYRIVTVVGGSALFAYLVYSIGVGPVLTSFAALSWRLGIVVLFPAVCLKVCDVFSWRAALPTSDVRFSTMLVAVLGGQAVSSTTPTGPFGGDAVKLWMLRDEVSRRETLASLIVMQTTSTASQGLFLLLGVLIARRTASMSTPLLHAMEWLVLLEACAVAAFVAVQVLGGAAGVQKLLARWGVLAGSGTRAAAVYVDRTLVDFYRRQPRRLIRSLAWAFVGWLMGAAEVWLILMLLGRPVGVDSALTIEAFGTGISFATFFLPVQIGVDEGGAVATFVALGLSGATGLSLSLVRRVREITWVAIGLLLLAGKPRPAVRVAAEA
jgi:hypothetical protein